MRIAFIADGRAENFRRWAKFFVRNGDEVSVLSTYPCDPLEDSALFKLPGVIRASNTLVKRSDMQVQSGQGSRFSQWIIEHGYDHTLYSTWSIVKTFDIWSQMWFARRKLKEINPDIVVAFRTQNEGYVAGMTGFHPWILFTQGSDFVYMAERHAWHKFLTRGVVRKADGLMSDCQRDINLARYYGFPQTHPARLFPGNGGVDLAVYRPGVAASDRKRWIVYPRGLAPYLRLDTFLSSINALQQEPDYSDVCYKLLVTPDVIPVALSMAYEQGLDMSRVEVLPFMSQPDLSTLLQQAAVIVSPSLTDGTPNSMLEAMACGAFPVMSNLESIQEWIHHGKNGLLFDPTQPSDLLNCLQQALDNVALRSRAQLLNWQIIKDRADYNLVMPALRQFLQNMVTKSANV